MARSPGLERVLGRLGRIASRRRYGEVVGELAVVRRQVGGVHLLQGLSDFGMQPKPLTRAQLGVERVLDKRMGEAVPLGDHLFVDQPGADRFFQRVQDRLCPGLADPLQYRQGEVAPDDRGDGQHVVAAAESRSSRRPTTSRTLSGMLTLHEAMPRLAAEAALGDEQAHDLADEERVALGLALHGLHQGRFRLDSRWRGR